MTQPFPEHIFLASPTAPSGIECDAPDLIIEDELPADLQGVYFRNGPDPLYPPREGDEYHWFHGDGMIQRFEFSGGLPMAWEPERGTHFGVIPRNGTAAGVTWHSMDARWSFHMVNAWDEGDTIKVDVCASNATRFAPKLDGTMADADEGISPLQRRWTIDVGGTSNAVREELLDDMSCEFPRLDDRYMTRAHRHVFLVGGSDAQLMFNRLVHYDAMTGSRKIWGEDRYLLGEPVFAPRAGATGEGDGYLLILAYDQTTSLSHLRFLCRR